MEYASRAVGNAGLATGIIGTALGALNGAGGLDLLNFGPRRPRDEGDIPVTRHDMGLYRELSEKDFKIASLESNKYTDQQANLACLQNQIAQLQSMTQLVIPNRSVMPGWGPVEITAAGGTVATAATGTGTNG